MNTAPVVRNDALELFFMHSEVYPALVHLVARPEADGLLQDRKEQPPHLQRDAGTSHKLIRI